MVKKGQVQLFLVNLPFFGFACFAGACYGLCRMFATGCRTEPRPALPSHYDSGDAGQTACCLSWRTRKRSQHGAYLSRFSRNAGPDVSSTFPRAPAVRRRPSLPEVAEGEFHYYQCALLAEPGCRCGVHPAACLFGLVCNAKLQ